MSEYISYTFNYHDPITANRDRVFPFLVGKHHGDRVEVPIPTLSKKAALNDVGIGTLGGAAMGAVGGGYATRGLLSLLGASQKVKNIGTGLGVLGGGLAGAYLGNKEDEYIKDDPIGSKKSETEGRMNKYLYGGLGALGAAGGDLTAYALGEGDNPAFRVLSAVAGAGLGTLGASWLKQGDIREVYEKLSPNKKEVVRKALSGKSPQEKRKNFPLLLLSASKDPSVWDKLKEAADDIWQRKITGNKPESGEGPGETPVPGGLKYELAEMVAPKGEINPWVLGIGGGVGLNYAIPAAMKLTSGASKSYPTFGPRRLGFIGYGPLPGMEGPKLFRQTQQLSKIYTDFISRPIRPTDEEIITALSNVGLNVQLNPKKVDGKTVSTVSGADVKLARDFMGNVKSYYRATDSGKYKAGDPTSKFWNFMRGAAGNRINVLADKMGHVPEEALEAALSKKIGELIKKFKLRFRAPRIRK